MHTLPCSPLQVLDLDLSEAEVADMSQLFQAWGRGFLPPAVELPFTPLGQGMAARWGRAAAAPPPLPVAAAARRTWGAGGGDCVRVRRAWSCQSGRTPQGLMRRPRQIGTLERTRTRAWRHLVRRAEIRQKIIDRLASGRLPPGGLIEALQQYYGPEGGEGVIDNAINIMFAGHETS